MIGVQTQALVERLLAEEKFALKNLHKVQGILGLSKQFEKEAMEYGFGSWNLFVYKEGNMIETETLLNELQFCGMKNSLQFRLSEVIQENHTHHQFITFLLEDEKLCRNVTEFLGKI